MIILGQFFILSKAPTLFINMVFNLPKEHCPGVFSTVFCFVFEKNKINLLNQYTIN